MKDMPVWAACARASPAVPGLPEEDDGPVVPLPLIAFASKTMGGTGGTTVGEPMPTSPIITVGQPMMIGFTGPSASPGISMTMSPSRQAIMLLISTVGLPIMTMPTPSAPLMLTAGHACWSIMARQAGRPPMSTLTLPGPGARGMPWVVGSSMRAAGGMVSSSNYWLSFPPFVPSSAVSGSFGSSGLSGLSGDEALG